MVILDDGSTEYVFESIAITFLHTLFPIVASYIPCDIMNQNTE